MSNINILIKKTSVPGTPAIPFCMCIGVSYPTCKNSYLFHFVVEHEKNYNIWSMRNNIQLGLVLTYVHTYMYLKHQ